MAHTDCDVVVVGLGPGGEALVAQLASAGLDVVAVEAELVGGECPYWGCVPSKMMIRAANAVAEARRVASLAGTAEVTVDFAQVAQRIRHDATSDWDDQVAAERITDAGARLVRGHGRLAGERTVQVGHTTFKARRAVVLNTGTSAALPPIDGLADAPVWTNREAVSATEAPASLAVIGGGAIGLELAQAFHRLGSEVTVLEGGERILGVEEPEASELLAEVFTAEGIGVHEGVSISHVGYDGARFHVAVDQHVFEVDQVLVATGRKPRTDDIGLDTVGLEPGGRLSVDDAGQVKPGLWAIGDITGRGAFTHISMYQAHRAAQAILGHDLPAYDHSLPRVTFTDPEVGAVGLTEAQARAQGMTVRTSVTALEDSSRGWLHKVGAHGLIKLVIDDERDVVVGATSAGPTGGETLSALALAVRAEISVQTLRNMVYAYPTFWRAIESAL